MISLRARLRRVLAVTLVSCWVAGVGMVVVYTANSENSLWDGKLQTFATRLLLSLPSNKLAHGPVVQGLMLPPTIRQHDAFSFQVWRRDRTLFLKTPGAPAMPFEPSFEDGFSSHIVDGRKWRIYTISDRSHFAWVQVANLQSVVDREMQYEVLTALAILTAVLLVLGALLRHALDRSLRPLAVLADAIRRRRDFDLAPLQARDLPRELQPLVGAFNHLLEQLDKAVTAERRFIGDAAHELRTPLSVMQAQAEVALHASGADEKDKALRCVQQGARRTARLAEQLLDLARLDGMDVIDRTGAIDVSELVTHIVREHAYYAAHRGCVLDMAAAPALAAGDIDELAILLRNLVDNAVRFAGAGGHVVVACGSAADGAWVAVTDDGPGVPEHERDAIFQRFYRLPGNDGRGSGIGLSLVAAIARLHGARIVTGEGLDGRGFSVRILFRPLPAAPAPTAMPAVVQNAMM
nr:ATP-binding protein [uncultured Massilia sp.]